MQVFFFFERQYHFLETESCVTITAAGHTWRSVLTGKHWPVPLLEVSKWNELQFLLFARDFDLAPYVWNTEP